ncbi:MAG: capsid protein [Wigfec virus K19_668]|nr:MAG: capsid protein [Wigfec virus K19_668]
MPYRRYSGYRRRGGYRRRYPRRSTGGVDYIKMAKTAYSGVKYLKSLVNVEKHPHETNYNITPDQTTGNFTCLNLIAQGDGTADRTGNRIKMFSTNANIRVTINSLASNTCVRIIMFMDRQANGSVPALSELLNNGATIANYNHDYAQRFPILADRKVNLSISGKQETTLRIYRKLGMHTDYDGATASAGDIVTNSLYIFIISDEGTNTPTVVVRNQLLFVDN